MVLTDAEYAEIKIMLEAGVRTSVVAEETGHATTTIARVRKELGIPLYKEDPYAGDDVDAIVQDYRAGMRVADICIKYKFGYAKLYNLLAAVGEPTRTRSPSHRAGKARALEEALAMYEGGYMIRTIAAETGVSQVTLHAEIERRGVQHRNKTHWAWTREAEARAKAAGAKEEET
jgi:uncharacterized protein YerC